MNLETVFDFIKEKRGYDYPLEYKLLNGIELTEKDLHYEGDLDLYGLEISSLPNNFHVDGYLDIRKTNITELPDNLSVDSGLIINELYITSIPNNLYIGSDLYNRHTPLAEMYSDSEIARMIIDKGGFVSGDIISERR